MKKNLKLNGATCPSCVYAIQRAGGKLKGVDRIEVDPLEKTISLEYDGDENVVDSVREMVDKLGYSADPIDDN
jgi:Cu+-exporting ATPase